MESPGSKDWLHVGLRRQKSGVGLLVSDIHNWVHGATLHRDGLTGRNQAGAEKERNPNVSFLQDIGSLFLSVNSTSPVHCV